MQTYDLSAGNNLVCVYLALNFTKLISTFEGTRIFSSIQKNRILKLNFVPADRLGNSDQKKSKVLTYLVQEF